MTYWDSSALVCLFLEQTGSRIALDHRTRDPHVVTAWHAVPECASAFCRLRREAVITEQELRDLLSELETQSAHWFVVPSGKRLERLSLRLLRVHPLRAMDAIHLAAACIARGEPPTDSFFLTHDARLAEAASKEGFLLPN